MVEAGEKATFAGEPVVGVVVGGTLVVLADVITWGVSAVAAHGHPAGSFAELLETFPVIAALPAALVIAAGGLIARRPWIALGGLIGLIVSVILLPGQCLIGISAGWIRIAG